MAADTNEKQSPDVVSRRSALKRLTRLFMGGGLVAAYGTLAAVMARYLFPARPAHKGWMFVTDLKGLGVGESLVYRTPSGATVNVTRQGGGQSVEDFLALSSVCRFRDRLPISGESLRELTNEPVPHHLKRWWFAIGGTPAYLFVVQIVTGILLAIYYESSTKTAYESVRYITEEAAFGWYLRGLHKWGATLMIAGVILHQMRVYFTGAYRKLRELNWMVGMALLMSTLMLGFTGYSLVYEQLSFWGATVAANLTGSVPVVGDFMRAILLGGETYGRQTLPRFFILHAAVLPVLLILLLGIHLALIRLQGVTELRFESEPEEKPSSTLIIPPSVDRRLTLLP